MIQDRTIVKASLWIIALVAAFFFFEWMNLNPLVYLLIGFVYGIACRLGIDSLYDFIEELKYRREAFRIYKKEKFYITDDEFRKHGSQVIKQVNKIIKR